jgi:hypothetical protein
MSLNAATIELLLRKGLSGDDLLDIARAMETDGKPRSAGARRQARYRERKLESVTSDVTSDVTNPLKDNSKPPSSVSNETGVPPADPIKLMFDAGLALLTGTGTPEKQARSLLGKWKKARGEAEVLAAIMDCRRLGIASPVEWMEKRLRSAKYVSKSGYEYRGTDEQVLREAEKRHDMDTYWSVHRVLREKKAAA